MCSKWTNSVGEKTVVIALNNSKFYLIDNILASPILMKNWVLKILKQCNNIGYVMIGQYQSSNNVIYALNRDYQLFVYHCNDDPKKLINSDLPPKYSLFDDSYCAYIPFDVFLEE